jgi:proteasome beta subunit
MNEASMLKTGTTTVGIITKDAVVLASESKATSGYTVESKVARKVFKLDDQVGMTIAGSVGDAQALIRIMKAQLKLYRLERGAPTVRAAANLLSNILQGSKGFPFLNILIVGGYDPSGPAVYSIDPVGGYTNQDKFYATGSGSSFVYGVLEASYKENMSTDDVLALAIKAIKAAIERDIGSGGKEFTVAVIDKNGYRELTASEMKKYTG